MDSRGENSGFIPEVPHKANRDGASVVVMKQGDNCVKKHLGQMSVNVKIKIPLISTQTVKYPS